MQEPIPKYFIIDFDSTFIKHEGLEELASISLKKDPQRTKLLKQITNLTNRAMCGEMSFDESLSERLKLLKTNKAYIKETAEKLKKDISHSIARNKTFFQNNHKNIYIISGGFRDLIVPVVASFGIPESHVFANTFIFDKNDNVVGIDKNNFLSQNNGKAKQVEALGLKGDIYAIGDGHTDYQLKKVGIAKEFIAFTENIEREEVMKKADTIAPSFDEFLMTNKLQRTLSYPKSKISVLLLENINQDAVVAFEKEGYSVKYFDKSLSEEELVQAIETTSILCIRSRTQLTPKIIAHAERLISVGVFAIGVNQVDLFAATQKGISVFNAPYSNTRSVVELVIGEMIMLMRNVFEKSTKLHQGIWDKSAKNSYEVKGKTLGIIGYGNIGTQVGIIAEALGMKVCFYDKVEKLTLGNVHQCETIEELLKTSDIVTIHVDGNKNNKHLMSDQEFRLMKKGALFINASRGFVVDEKALITYLKNGQIRGAALDVYPTEPKSNSEPFVSELQNFPNVILTPHIGGSTTEAQKNIAHFVSQKIIDYVNTGSTYLSVNMPNIQLPKQGEIHRLLHMHKNVPGVLAQINNIFAQNNINIYGQYLKTNEDIGYVITDVDTEYNKYVLDSLKNIPETIRFRVLY